MLKLQDKTTQNYVELKYITKYDPQRGNKGSQSFHKDYISLQRPTIEVCHALLWFLEQTTPLAVLRFSEQMTPLAPYG
jgi:hypothetical protein